MIPSTAPPIFFKLEMVSGYAIVTILNATEVYS